MEKKILFGLLGLVVLVAGMLFVSATLGNDEEKPAQEDPAAVSTCGGAAGCGPDTCDGSCGGTCGNPKCGCGR